MITTRDINVKIDKKEKKLKTVTTKDIKLKYPEGPLKPAAGPLITTHNIEEFQKKDKMAKVRAAKKGKKK